MRNDLYVGALIALGVHTTLALISPMRRVQISAERPPVIEVKPWPVDKIEPEPEPETGDPAEIKETSVAAPRLLDVPRLATPEAFTMPPTLVPEGAPIDSNVLTIPTERVGPKKDGRDIVDLVSLDRAPLARFQAQPQYPFEMKRNGIAGEVLVEFIVDANGAVRDAHAVRSSQREFESAAVQAVSKWAFRPGQKDGRNVATRMQVPIVFSLNESND